MRRLGLLILLLAAFTCTAFAGAITITFDDLSMYALVGNSYLALPGGPSFGAGQAFVIPESPGYPAESSPIVAGPFSNASVDITWTTGTVSNLSLWYVNSDRSIIVIANDSSGAEINRIERGPNAGTGANISIDGSEIQHLLIVGGASAYVIDDVSYDLSGVPEPASFAAMALGLAALLARRLRK
jgi:hypothetical protein